MLYRFALKALENWFHDSTRKPLVIRGARQVGKTALVRLFCKEQNLDLIEVNLEEVQIHEFSRPNFDVQRCLNEILALTNKDLSPNTILFIDEIQESLQALNRLRFFWEKKPEIPVVVAGSLLEAKLRTSKLKVPVGRLEYLFLGPMIFKEFLLARGEEKLVKLIGQLSNHHENPISPSVHQKLVNHLTDFFFVGGMPEAVHEFVESEGQYLRARSVQRRVLQSYYDDIERYAGGKLSDVLHEVLNRLPSQTGRKVIYKNYSEAKSTYVKEAIDLLESIFVLQKVFHTNASGLPLKQTEDRSLFKLYLLDVGLYNCSMEVPWSDLSGMTYEDLLTKGHMAEQFVAQHLFLHQFQMMRPATYYWLRDKGTQKAEVDFVMESHRSIWPIEVKSGSSGSIKSLLQFMSEREEETQHALRYDLQWREYFREHVRFKRPTSSTKAEHPIFFSFTLHSLPLYAIGEEQHYIGAVR